MESFGAVSQIICGQCNVPVGEEMYWREDREKGVVVRKINFCGPACSTNWHQENNSG